MTTTMPFSISGFDPEKLSTCKLLIRSGSCPSLDGKSFAKLITDITLDMSKTGLNGLDTGTPTDGYDYFIYIVKDETTHHIGAVISHAKYYDDVIVPVGYTMYRKLPFSFIYNSSRDGIPDFHLSNLSMPTIRSTEVETTAEHAALASGASASFADVSLGFVPDKMNF